MNPGQAPVRMDGLSIAMLSFGFGVLTSPPEWVDWAATHIEPIESGDEDDQPK